MVQDSISEQDPSAVDRIDTAIDRLLSIFDNHHQIIDQLTAPQSGEPIDVVVVLEAIIQEYSDTYPAVTITSDLPESVTVSAVPALTIALQELIENAIVHNDRKEPRVDIVVEATESMVTIQISDDGPLIPEMEYQSFSSDYQVNSTHHATGFGLWLVYLVVMRSGGSLHFDGGETRGNVVTVVLPPQPTTWSN
jgi:signal transduction histidine kinase